MIEVTSRRMECTLLTSNYSQTSAVALQWCLPLRYNGDLDGCVGDDVSDMGEKKFLNVLPRNPFA